MTEDQNEIARLREHNAELLGEAKKAKAQAKELATQVENLTAERDEARTEFRQMKLDNPVNEMLTRISVLPEYFKTEFTKRGYSFVLTDEGIAVHDADGNPAQVPVDYNPKAKLRDASFSAEDLQRLVTEDWKPESERHASVDAFNRLLVGSQASGGGAQGSRGLPAQPVKPAPTQPAPTQFGLR